MRILISEILESWARFKKRDTEAFLADPVAHKKKWDDGAKPFIVFVMSAAILDEVLGMILHVGPVILLVWDLTALYLLVSFKLEGIE